MFHPAEERGLRFHLSQRGPDVDGCGMNADMRKLVQHFKQALEAVVRE